MEKDQNKTLKSELIGWVKVVVCAVVFALIINNFVIVNASVPTGSMETTIMPGDRVVAFRLGYMLSEPERFDIVVFPFPDDKTGKVLYVKRIIGMPGETLEVSDGKVYINDSPEPLDDSFVKENPTGNFGPYTIPEDCYFMMGDNRNLSADSRFWNSKFLSRDKILGKVVFRYYPFNSIGTLNDK